jgi:Protein of unknown function (DUF998)
VTPRFLGESEPISHRSLIRAREIQAVYSVDSVRPVLGGERIGGNRAAVWATTALVCFGVSVAVVLALTFELRGQVDPVHQVISDYALFGGAGAFTFSALTLAGGTVSLLIALARAGIPTTAPVRVLAGIWSVGLTLCAFFRTTLTGAPLSFSGEVHRYGGIALFVGLPSATQLLARHLRRQPPWRRLGGRIHGWTRWAWRALAAFGVSQLPAVLPASHIVGDILMQGLVERLLFLVYLAPLAELAVVVLRGEKKPC